MLKGNWLITWNREYTRYYECQILFSILSIYT